MHNISHVRQKWDVNFNPCHRVNDFLWCIYILWFSQATLNLSLQIVHYSYNISKQSILSHLPAKRQAKIYHKITDCVFWLMPGLIGSTGVAGRWEPLPLVKISSQAASFLHTWGSILYWVCYVRMPVLLQQASFSCVTCSGNMCVYIGDILENVEHCGGEPEQADTACLLPNWNGCQEKAFMSSV